MTTLSPEAVYALRSGAALTHDLDAEIDRLTRDLDTERTQRKALAARCIVSSKEIGELKGKVEALLNVRGKEIDRLRHAQAALVARCNHLSRALAKKAKHRPTDDLVAAQIVAGKGGAA